MKSFRYPGNFPPTRLIHVAYTLKSLNMKNLLYLILVVILVQGCSNPAPQESNSDLIKKVETGLSGQVYFVDDTLWTIEDRMKHYNVPGVSLAIINDGKIEWFKTYGVMNKDSKEPVTKTTLFQAGSISKPVAAYGALHVVESGKINLDENVNTYLKSWKLPDNEFTSNKKVALKHLLNHSGGVTVHGFPGYSSDLPVPTLVQVLNGEAPANTPPIRADKVPEKSFRYSGGGYTIMQQMLIDVEGKPFPLIMKEIVLDPLAMTNSTYDQPLTGELLKRAASGYLPNDTMTKGERHTYPEMAAAGLWTTAEDLAKFAIDVQQSIQGKSNSVLSQPMANKMTTPFVEDFVGLGLFLENLNGEHYFSHNGWDEGFSAQLVAHKDKGYGMVILINANKPEFMSEVLRSVARTYAWPNYTKTFTKMKMDTANFAALRGRYHNESDGSLMVSTKGDKLYMKYLRAKTPYELFRISDSTYAQYRDSRPVQFKVNPADGKLNLVLVEDGKAPAFVHPRESEDTRVPYEYLLKGDFDTALKGYQVILKADPNDYSVNEESLNNQGYTQLNEGKTKLAKDLFKVNMLLHPESANVYDSYAEAAMKLGDKKEAIANYKKSLKLNPANKNAEKNLKELEKN